MRSGPPTDDDLVAAHRAGDQGAFAALVGRHSGSLRALAVRTLHHPEDAADVVQEALASAYRRAGEYRGDASVRTWLHRILVNACVDRIRYDRRRATLPLAGEGTVRDLAGEVATRLVLADALAALPVEQRLAVVLVDAQGWSVGEAAHLLEVPAGTVKSRCARGRARLAELVGHLREDP
ncbi:RNA polymerase sigma factor SigM [Pseudonocardia lacus]|uniref:RNA polymerase sigma factor SigM n=1 Tax=Pseudonocardia lacus TaxID=2835865 RepID=UPI001BDC8D5A|nr:RNA polymerase sigma factor SigM [Pseudonocardia lacus]